MIISGSNKLIEINKLLEDPVRDMEISLSFEKISNRIGYKIPNNVIRLIELSETINDLGYFWIFDAEVLSIQQIQDIYNDVHDELGFFAKFQVDESFKMDGEFGLELFDHSDIERDSCDEVIEDVSRFMPIAQEQIAFTAIDLKCNNRIVSINEDYSAVVLAPNLNEHFNDLIKGVEKGLYKFDRFEDLEYPLSWRKRQLLNA